MRERQFRVAFGQIDTTIGDFQGNIAKVVSSLDQAFQLNADLVLFPELVISSYPPLDLLDRDEFVRSNAAAFDALSKVISAHRFRGVVVFGTLEQNPSSDGRALRNCAAVFKAGSLVASQAKRLLPTYDVFDEHRYFEPGRSTYPVDTPWGKMGVVICEDSWFEEEHAGRSLYPSDPADDLIGCDFVVNISASPFELNKRVRRKERLAGFARKTRCPLFYVNQVGANDEILFDGSSLVFDSNGNVAYEFPSFREGLGLAEVSLGRAPLVLSARFDAQAEEGSILPDDQSDMGVLYRGLVTGVRDYFRKTGFQTAVLGLSGGIDSALVACIASDALGPSNVTAVAMPSQYSSSHSLTDAEALAKNLGVQFRVHSLKFLFSTILMELKSSFAGKSADVTEENLQARLRAVLLMSIANKHRSLLLTTGNKSELAVGYCTTYGDMAGALAPLGDVYKTKVYDLARWRNQRGEVIPRSTIEKPPSAELRPNQTDQDSLPPYDVLDAILSLHIEGRQGYSEITNSGFEPGIVEQVLNLVKNSEFKRRQAAPCLKTSTKAFGLGRRIPVVWRSEIGSTRV